MRKILITVVIVLLLVLAYHTAMDGLEVFGYKVMSIQEIQDKNRQLDNQIKEVGDLASLSYPKAKKDLQTSAKSLLKQKDAYADLVSFSSSEEVDAASKFQVYDMEYLRTRFGTYATKNGVKIKIDVVSAGGENQYNLRFTATGRYVGITEFISAIEKDTSFAFRIENFRLIPQTNTENLQATFSINNVSIKNINKVTSSSGIPTPDTQNTTQADTTNNTNDTTNTTENNS